MASPINLNPPRVLWVDMNSSFATSEQQAHPLWRGKPLGVGKYVTPNGPVIGPSVEAKRHGIRTAHTVRDCKLLCPEIIITKTDPPKYREMHRRLLRVFRRWSPDVIGKSIDEACINFEGSPALRQMSMEEIGAKIKAEIREECGKWVRVSVGIATNQFLAKVAAGLKKPDGLERLGHANLRDVFAGLALTDLPGINTRYAARLNVCGIHTPLQFLDADADFLHRQVFGSIVGRYWHLMLHGFEHQGYEGPERRTFGNSHSIRIQKPDPAHNLAILCKLCDMASRRMRREAFSCRRVSVTCIYPDRTFFHKGRTQDVALHSTKEIFRVATLCFNRQPELKAIHKLAVRCSMLQPGAHEQMNLFEDLVTKRRKAMEAVDRINDRYGEQVVYMAPMHGAKGCIDDSISFGSVGDMQELYEGEEAFPPLEEELWLQETEE